MNAFILCARRSINIQNKNKRMRKPIYLVFLSCATHFFFLFRAKEFISGDQKATIWRPSPFYSARCLDIFGGWRRRRAGGGILVSWLSFCLLGGGAANENMRISLKSKLNRGHFIIRPDHRDCRTWDELCGCQHEMLYQHQDEGVTTRKPRRSTHEMWRWKSSEWGRKSSRWGKQTSKKEMKSLPIGSSARWSNRSRVLNNSLPNRKHRSLIK